MSQEEDYFVEGTPQELISYRGDITADLYSLKGSEYVARRLQRNITNLIKE